MKIAEILKLAEEFEEAVIESHIRPKFDVDPDYETFNQIQDSFISERLATLRKIVEKFYPKQFGLKLVDKGPDRDNNIYCAIALEMIMEGDQKGAEEAARKIARSVKQESPNVEIDKATVYRDYLVIVFNFTQDN